MALEERYEMLEARCSGGAVDYLRQYRNHPRLPELITMLEQIDGLIFVSYIEQAIAKLVRRE